jgi:maltose O-acetyltransferase
MDYLERRNWTAYNKPVRIGDDCWIGGGAIICPGVTIGPRSIIGAGAVVTRDIPADSVAVGNPARVIRSLSPDAPRGWELAL